MELGIIKTPKIKSMTLKPSFSSLLGLLMTLAAAASGGEYRLIKEIPIGGEGGWDYLTVDESARLLYVSHATKVVVVDLAQDRVIGEITNTPGVHGLAPAPDLNRGFVSCGREDKAAIVDLKSLQIISKVATGKNPDAMLYDPSRHEVYMFNGRGESATVIDAKTGKVGATIPLGGKPEYAAVDTAAGRVYNNLEDKSEVAVIDTRTHSITNRWPIAPGEEATGMALDAKNHRLVIGCGNRMMLMMDSTTGKVLCNVPIGEGVDANAFDPATRLAFASCGDGTVTIAHQDSADKLTVVQTLQTARGARTMALDSRTHRIYLGAAEYEVSGDPTQKRPKIISGSFKILVYGTE
jgi:YVTN family beta-propeller protein